MIFAGDDLLGGVAGVTEVAGGVDVGDGIERGGDGGAGMVDRQGAVAPQVRLDLAEGLLDGVEDVGLGGGVDQLGAGVFDNPASSGRNERWASAVTPGARSPV